MILLFHHPTSSRQKLSDLPSDIARSTTTFGEGRGRVWERKGMGKESQVGERSWRDRENGREKED
jgi:hypothetical protein